MSPDGTSCGVLDACDVAGVCEGGLCTGASELSCDDADACTIDLCEPELGLCEHTPVLCAPDPASPCAQPTCSASEGCELANDETCTEESLLWYTSFPCNEGEAWSWVDPSNNSPSFALNAEAPAAGTLSADCHAQIKVSAEQVAVNSPWTSKIVSGAVDVPDEVTGPLRVRFWHAWEWEGGESYQSVERRLQVLDESMQVIESHPLAHLATDWGTWQQVELELTKATGSFHLAFALTSKPANALLGCSWTIDHVVVFSAGASPSE